jgi:plasmid stabilization system protein ParE
MVMADHIVLPVAQAEFLAVHAQQSVGGSAAASRFEYEFVQAVADIRAWPEAWPLVQDDDIYRFRRFKKLPYLVIYRLDGDVAVIVAVRHHRQQTGTWKGR